MPNAFNAKGVHFLQSRGQNYEKSLYLSAKLIYRALE